MDGRHKGSYGVDSKLTGIQLVLSVSQYRHYVWRVYDETSPDHKVFKYNAIAPGVITQEIGRTTAAQVRVQECSSSIAPAIQSSLLFHDEYFVFLGGAIYLFYWRMGLPSKREKQYDNKVVGRVALESEHGAAVRNGPNVSKNVVVDS